MALAPNMQNPGSNQGKGSTTTADRLGLFLKVFAGEVLAAFSRSSLAIDKFITRTISNGKSAQFPVMGRATAKYLDAGASLDTNRSEIKHTEKVINIDGLLTADVLIFDLDDAMNHYDVASEYSKQIGESLAIAADQAILAELAVGANSDENIDGLGAGVVLDAGITAIADLSDASKVVNVGQAVIQGLARMRGKLSNNYVPASERYAFVTPDIYSAIVAALQPQGANFDAMTNQETGVLKNISGFQVIEVPHLLNGGIGGKHAFPTTASTAAAPKVNKTNLVALV
ncbi:UNVERIFIED_CONTAM: hypothetical protein RF648_19130, partial [Kocuria sp. CPCC 205274]